MGNKDFRLGMGLFSLFMGILGFLIAYEPKKAEDFGNGISIGIFFLLCGIVLIYSYIQELKISRELETPVEKVNIEGGRKFYISRKKIFYLGFLLFISFSIMAYLSSINKIFTAICGFVALVGFVLIIANLFKIIGDIYLIFEEDGFCIGNKKGSFLIPWDNLGVSLESWNNNYYIFITILDHNYIVWKEGKLTQEKLIKKYLKVFTTNLGFMGCDYFFIPEQFGFSSGIFLRAMQTYIALPEERKGLRKLERLE